MGPVVGLLKGGRKVGSNWIEKMIVEAQINKFGEKKRGLGQKLLGPSIGPNEGGRVGLYWVWIRFVAQWIKGEDDG